jgi:hypothetical protein
MKYYVYVSESKIQMLFEQTGAAIKGPREATLGFDIKLLKGSIKEGTAAPESTYAKMDRVLHELKKNDRVGEIYETKPYIHGLLSMIWANYVIDPDSPMAFWGYKSKDIVLGLAGSNYNVLGKQPEGEVCPSYSLKGAIMEWFRNNIGESLQPSIPRDSRSREIAEEIEMGDEIDSTIYRAVRDIKGYTDKFEFVAKVLHRGKCMRDSNLILASPLYVSMEE